VSTRPEPMFIPHGTRCEADDGRGSDFGQCSMWAAGAVIHAGRQRYVCTFHLQHYKPTPAQRTDAELADIHAEGEADAHGAVQRTHEED
jgi:hypothetical protein